MARTEVTLEINTYIRAHNLQDPNNGRRIFADAKLRKLLKLTKEDELTYFNLQRYMSPHFAKATKKVCDTNTLFARYTEGGLKVIFLAYLRELNQLDQSFSQKMIESDVLTENDISFFKQKLNESMSEAVNILQEVKKKNEIPTETTPLVTSASNSLSLVGRNTTV